MLLLSKLISTKFNIRQNRCSSNKNYFYFRDRFKKLKGKCPKRSVEWILEKKERRRQQGRKTCLNSKYTGRRRSGKF